VAEIRSLRPGRTALALLGTAAATAPLSALAAHAWGGPKAAASAGLGAALATLSALGGVYLTAWAMPRPQNVFFGALVGGILARMVLFCGAVAVLVTATDLPPGAFIAGLFVYYVIYQVLEIRALHRYRCAAGTGLNPERPSKP